MAYNIMAGRLRHRVGICERNTEPNEDGEVVGFTSPTWGYGEVMTRSGSEASKFGTEVTTTVITVLMWRNNLVNNASFILFNGVYYSVKHIAPDETNRSMVVTAMVEER